MPSDDLVSRMDFTVRGYDCGYGGPLRPFALANFLQEAAGVNAAALGFGMDDLFAAGRTWMLSRLDMRVDRLPCEGESVVARTWPAGARRLFAMRAIELRAPGRDGSPGECLVRAVYAYLIVDIAARRPLRPEGLFGPAFPGEGLELPLPAYDFSIPRPPVAGAGPEGEPQTSFAQRVSSRHIDHNGHANNAHIINWLVDAAATALAGSSGGAPRSLAALRVEFANEALEGDELVAQASAFDGTGFGEPRPARSAIVSLVRGEAAVARALVGFGGA